MTIVAVLLAWLFIWLGFWQLERAAYKRELAANMEFRERQPAILLTGTTPPAPVQEFSKVRVSGYFEPERQVLIENRKHRNRNGYHVITPLNIADTELRVLVNRGWVPMGADRLSTPELTTPKGLVQIEGRATIPEPPALVLNAKGIDAGLPARWPYLTIDRFASYVDYPVKPFVILQSPDGAHGYIRQWPKRQPSDGMHIGYAIQWFAFALITIIIFLNLSLTHSRDSYD